METEVIRPVMEFKTFIKDEYFSAPSSPTRFSLPPFLDLISLTSSTNQEQEQDHEFDFEFTIHDEHPHISLITTADELFSGGKIRTVNDPFEKPNSLTKQSSRRSTDHDHNHESRERERISSKSLRRSARSLSPTPLRNSNYHWEEEPQKNPAASSKKWKFKDLFLFRSASEGRAAEKDPLRKYSAIFRRSDEGKGSSFRLAEGSISRRRTKLEGLVSAHEVHYTVNRAVSQELKKKSFLPYKQGILGRLAFIPTTVHGVTGGFGFSHK